MTAHRYAKKRRLQPDKETYHGWFFVEYVQFLKPGECVYGIFCTKCVALSMCKTTVELTDENGRRTVGSSENAAGFGIRPAKALRDFGLPFCTGYVMPKKLVSVFRMKRIQISSGFLIPGHETRGSV